MMLGESRKPLDQFIRKFICSHNMAGELESEPRPTCWDRWAGWSWKVVSPCRLTGLILTLMTSERFVWIQMSSDGFVWICMGSDELRYIQIQI